jgi:hypothetical protein
VGLNPVAAVKNLAINGLIYCMDKQIVRNALEKYGYSTRILVSP